jgi:hypothetical protein
MTKKKNAYISDQGNQIKEKEKKLKGKEEKKNGL